MYAVQNDTEIKFNIVLYIKSYFRWAGCGYTKGLLRKRKLSNLRWWVNRRNHDDL